MAGGGSEAGVVVVGRLFYPISSRCVRGAGRAGAPRIALGYVSCLPRSVALPTTMRPADASVEGVLKRPLSTCVSLLQGAGVAPPHSAHGLLQLEVPTVSCRLQEELARAVPSPVPARPPLTS